MTIQKVGEFLLGLIAAWQNPVNVTADLADLVLVLDGAAHLTGSPLASAVLKQVQSTAAGAVNLGSGQVAQAFSLPASFEGVEDDVLVFAVRKYRNGTAPEGSPAATVKALLGY